MSELDFEIIPIILIIFILGLFTPPHYFTWPVVAIFLFPQGRIFVRAFWDYPKMKKPKGMYLFINEAFVCLITLFFVGIYLWVKS